MNRRFAFAVILAVGFAGGFLWEGEVGKADELTGRASVIDGDTLEIHGQRIRLHGIDAPESGQSCRRVSGARWRCGQKAAQALAQRIRSQPVSCMGRDEDRYGRLIAVCEADGDLNAFMVRLGWAVAYRRYATDYIAAEREAKAAERGVWSGAFVMPWNWRRGERLPQSQSSSESSSKCRIKGNIASDGERIYHVPGGQYYGWTKIDSSKGERCFETEAEARANGWRPANR